jgi:hypothetical protein
MTHDVCRFDIFGSSSNDGSCNVTQHRYGHYTESNQE